MLKDWYMSFRYICIVILTATNLSLGVHGQPYFAVTIRGDTLAGQLAVWRISADGAISLHQSIPLVAGAVRIFVDPFGRYVLFPIEEGFREYRLALPGQISLAF
jgi:hypothetical protein